MRSQPTKSATWAALLLSLPLAVLSAEGPQAQVAGLSARHAEGQTILTWREVDPPTVEDKLTVKDFRAIRDKVQKGPKIRYRVYQSTKPIASLEGLSPVGEVPPLSCSNIEFYGDARPEQPALRYIVEEGKEPVPAGTGIYAHNPPEAGEAYYAVTVSVGGQENKTLTESNALKAAVQEKVGQGPFILQRVEKPKEFSYINSPELRFYVRWEAPPNCSIASRPYDYLVAIPPKPAPHPTLSPVGRGKGEGGAPVGIHLHCWGGSLTSGYGWWYNAEKGALLIASNQIPYDWWTGYHECLWTGQPLQKKEDWQKGVVRAYSQKRLLSFLDWVATKWEVDLTRVFSAGSSMGGAGSPMFAIRYPERIAWTVSWVGIHNPLKSPGFKGSYENVYGKPEYGVKFEDGTPVWDHFNDAWYLRKHPEKEIGFITFSNGKNDGGIGWPQAAEFFRALQETKRPHLFVWGQSGHGQRAAMPLQGGERINPIDIRTNQALPAFTGCSLDNNPGNGDPKDGDPQGQANLYLYWETADIVDDDDKLEMTVGLTKNAPKDECTVDITPRRCQKLRAKPGEKLKWANTSLAENKEAQRGELTADETGLITLPKVTVTKGKNRIRITK